MSAIQTRSKVNKNSEAHALKAIRTKWVYRFKKDKRGVVVRNKARLVAQGHRQEEGIDYDEVFVPVARIKAIRIFLAFASYMGFIVYQMDVKSAFLYGTIDEEVYVTQPSGFVDLKFPNKIYKVVKALYGLHQAPKAWYATLSTFLEKVKQKEDDIFISQDKYVTEILKKFDFLSVKTAVKHIITAVSYKLLLFGLTKDVAVNLMLIVDFLKAQVIRYALMVNPTIFVSCVKQFCATISIKKVNDVVKLRSLIDEKRVVVFEDVIRHDLGLDDADGVECLPNEEIFTELARMGYEKPPPKLMFYKALFIAQVDKGFSGVKTPLFATMLVQPQPPTVEEEDEVKVASAATPPSLIIKPTPPPQEPIITPPQAQPAPPSSPPQEQPTKTFESSMTLLTTLMETCTTLRMHPNKGRIKDIDADDEITLVDMETQANLGTELQGRKDDDNAAIKEASAAEPTMFDDEEVTMTMAQTLIKIKAKKARLLDEQMAKRLHDEEVEQATARAKQEKDDLKKAKMQEKHLDNIRKYQSLKRQPISIAQARKNMIVYLKNMAGYKMEHFKEEPQKKRVAKETLLQESFKKLKAVEVLGSHSTQDTPIDDPKEISEKDVKNILEIVPVSEFKVEALQVKSSDEDLHGGQQTKEQKFGYILQVIKKLELKKLDDLLAGVDAVQRLKKKALRD
uniref:Copia protein n=1 Tax=Tanacetum cinerariifolium TaxID=118510 RepID=A0A6L2N7C9_TANCI|nr:copia protein [Tanacetum cinerariifolium]